MVTITIANKTLEPRSDTITVYAGNAKPAKIVIIQAASEYIYSLSANRTSANFNFVAGSITFALTTDAPQWNIACPVDWINFSQTTGSNGTFDITMSVLINELNEQRSAIVEITAHGAIKFEIQITQNGSYPSYNTNPLTPDNTGMESNAAQLAAKMIVGWNIGNTLEAIGGETAWGNPLVSDELIKLVKQNGFNAIRIPCSWNQYLEDKNTAKIKTEWLNRVKTVVDYCVKNQMYVILNIHWDQGWLEPNCTPSQQAVINAKQKAFWEQIATHMRDFDEHLLFASANEPPAENAQQMAALNSYHQTFIDAVRSTGGRNSYRVLVIQGPSTDIDKTNLLMDKLPADKVENRLMAEIHYYTPFQFCLMTEDATWGKMFYYWGSNYHSQTNPERNATWGEEAELDKLMASMKTKFVDKGIPVILGEYAVIKRASLSGPDLDLHLNSRAYFLKYMTQQAIANGLIPFYWDAGNMGNNASALFNRSNNTVYDQQALDAIMQGASN